VPACLNRRIRFDLELSDFRDFLATWVPATLRAREVWGKLTKRWVNGDFSIGTSRWKPAVPFPEISGFGISGNISTFSSTLMRLLYFGFQSLNNGCKLARQQTHRDT
jgi:hypothetical protein